MPSFWLPPSWSFKVLHKISNLGRWEIEALKPVAGMLPRSLDIALTCPSALHLYGWTVPFLHECCGPVRRGEWGQQVNHCHRNFQWLCCIHSPLPHVILPAWEQSSYSQAGKQASLLCLSVMNSQRLLSFSWRGHG